MKKISLLTLALVAFASCNIANFGPTSPKSAKEWTKEEVESEFGPVITIKELASMYKTGESLNIYDSFCISGVICSTDKPGNFYKSFFIQDETGGIEIKAGKSGLYNDFLPGQRVYVYCKDLALGMYGYKSGSYGGSGMIQLGGSRNLNADGTPADDYETSYIENAVVIDSHILRGKVENVDYDGYAVVPQPKVITSSQLPSKTDTQVNNENIGRLVTLNGLTYANEIFCLLYLDSSKDKKSYTNRVFLSDTNGVTGSDKTHGVTTWAMSESKMDEYLTAGLWDACRIGSGSNYVKIIDPVTEVERDKTLGDMKGDGDYPDVERAAYSVTQVFKMGTAEIQVRTSGYCKFSDVEMDPEVRSGAKKMSITGILNMYQGTIQLTVNDVTDFVKE